MTTNAEMTERRVAAIPTGLSRHLDVFIDRAENAELWDIEGNRYIDFASGIAVTNTGHRHPKVLAAVREQLDQVTHTSFQTTPYANYVQVCERLNRLVPGDFPKKTYLVSTGAEAIENAVKIARAATGRSAFIAFAGAFHGRTLMATTLTGKTVPYKHGFGPMVPDVFHVPFPNAYHGVTVDQSLAALDVLFKTDLHPSRVAGIVVEPVQGEGGFNPAPAEFLQALRRICDEHGILLIVDEIQTGFARTGQMFAIEHAGIAADLMTLAKGLGGGFPIAAVTGRLDVMEKIPAAGVGGTFAGSPLSCAAALAVLDVIEEEGLVARAAQIGERLTETLRGWQRSNAFACVGDVRSLGSMVAMELSHDRDPKRPWPELTKLLTQKAAQHGLVLLSCGTYGNVIRVLAPLTIPDEILNEGIAALERALREALDELA
ncbi:4-aminobutyrate--2-oxoglutarate transaminase [Ruixingdingia sedimenti]|uniref:4-aminobutyrate--2-oxoglutarate transaminase n=1 Tax=Ruixingdingia sedimenti TaxID=3073604 RepID=A0ABU1F6E4_9RHOB|nr:4-aminobutyrate--2-oxoglutarate transaminase [Xinfangfangia sp. LG-4]MDR5652447.1 4-aminobutyrate--2-oxoglutarate transaminase [Xinfangfangia sp. LG-4]